MGRILQAGFGLFVVVSAAHDGLTQASPMRSVSICDIRSQSKKYIGKVVTVTGEVQRTSHGVSMSSSQCPTVGAALVESNEMEKSRAPESELLRDGTWKTFLCTDDRVFVVTVRGRFGTAVTRGPACSRRNRRPLLSLGTPIPTGAVKPLTNGDNTSVGGVPCASDYV